MKICKENNCGKKHYGKGYCHTHYQQVYRHGKTFVPKYERHGKTGHELFGTWRAIHQRCTNKNTKNYAHYGAKGIKVCDRWSSFTTFLEDMGERPSKYHTIERIDVDKGYNPNNCVWSDRTTQSLNRRIRGNSYGYRGVGMAKGGNSFFALVNFNKIAYRIPNLSSPEEAAYIYDQFILQLVGDDVPLNFLGNKPMYDDIEEAWRQHGTLDT